jgi:hypothetical protein
VVIVSADGLYIIILDLFFVTVERRTSADFLPVGKIVRHYPVGYAGRHEDPVEKILRNSAWGQDLEQW